MPGAFVSAVLIAIVVLAPKSGAAEVAVRIDDSGGVIVPVSINGSGPFSFLLDTGSTHSVVSRSLADRLALRFVAKTSVRTSTGREWRPVAVLDWTTIGGAQSEGLLASVAPSAELDAIARNIDGIVGQDFLFAFNYTLDYRKQRLTWHDGDSLAEGTRLPLVAQGGRYLVQLTLPDDKAPLLLVPDSGASGFVVYERDGAAAFAAIGAARFGEPGPAAMTSVHSLSGVQRARTITLRELRLGTITLRDQLVAVIPRDSNDVMEGDGLLPLHLFASVSFNARDGYLIVRGISGDCPSNCF